MILDDQLLLSRYTASRDAEAFAQLVQRYSAMVYSVACRVTGNVALAEDVTQDCFLTLARQTAAIRGSLPAWLHRVALNRSMEVVRSDATRQRREAAASASRPAHETTWKEMMPVVDAALAELPEDLREPLVQHFLLGCSQVQIAEALGVNQATVSRRTTEGIERLRGHLRRTGFVCGVALLTTCLTQSASAAVPSALATSLAKMAMAGPAKAATDGTIAAVVSAHAKLIAAIVAAVVGVGALSYHFMPKIGLLGTSTTGPNVRPYLSKLDLKGDGYTQDSFSLAFQAAAKALGRNADYDTVYALSTNAFCPAISERSDGRADWHVQAWLSDKGIGTLGARYGLSVRDLRQPNAPGSIEEYRELMAKRIAEAMDAVNIVLVTSGWLDQSEALPWAGIVTDVQPDGSISGFTIGGPSGNQLDKSSSIWVLSPGTETVTPHEADVLTLRSAIARIRGERPYQATKQSVYGLNAMDEWIKGMNEVRGFCPCRGCQAGLGDASTRRWNAAYPNAMVTQAASKVAASYLRRIAPDFPIAARPHIESAAGSYDRIVALLTPAVGNGPDSYQAFIGDLARQKVHVTKVLVPVKAEYAAIADDLERALKAE